MGMGNGRNGWWLGGEIGGASWGGDECECDCDACSLNTGMQVLRSSVLFMELRAYLFVLYCSYNHHHVIRYLPSIHLSVSIHAYYLIALLTILHAFFRSRTPSYDIYSTYPPFPRTLYTVLSRWFTCVHSYLSWFACLLTLFCF
jgi:hypothetical protein